MLREIDISGNFSISKEYMDKNGVVPQSSIMIGLLKELKHTKSSERHGYFMAVTKLNSIGKGELREETQDIIFPISFSCRTFLPVRDEIMCGVVYKVHSLGVFLKCGPMNIIYLSLQKMPNFHYENSENDGMFVRDDDLVRIQKDVVVRFVVFAVRWGMARMGMEREQEFDVLASLEGDGLGPVSLTGNDELYL